MSFINQFKHSAAVEKAITDAGYEYTAEGVSALVKDAKAGKDAEATLKAAAAEIEQANAAATAAKSESAKAKTDADAAIAKAAGELDAKASIKAQEQLAAMGFKGTAKNAPGTGNSVRDDLLKKFNSLSGKERAAFFKEHEKTLLGD